jgi:hypothetical protein
MTTITTPLNDKRTNKLSVFVSAGYIDVEPVKIRHITSAEASLIEQAKAKRLLAKKTSV